MHFPIEEYQKRVEKVRERMAERKIDLLLLYGQEAVCWLSGFYTPAYFSYTALGLPLVGNPFLVLRRMEEQAAASTTWVEDLYVYDDDQDPTTYVQAAVADRNCTTGHIAVDKNSWYLTVERFEQLKSSLEDASFVSEGRLVDQIRCIKSHLELEKLRAAARIVEAGMKEAIRATSPGVTEREVAAAMAAARLRAGSDLPVDGVLTSGERTAQGHGPWTDRVLKKGDQLYYEFHGIKDHYWARMLRSGMVGNVSDKTFNLHETLAKAQADAISLMLPGVNSREIDQACREPLIAKALKDQKTYVNRIGYGLGLNFRPTPGEFLYDFTPSNDFILESGMVFHMIVSAQGVGISDTIVVTDSHPEYLTAFPRGLFVI